MEVKLEADFAPESSLLIQKQLIFDAEPLLVYYIHVDVSVL